MLSFLVTPFPHRCGMVTQRQKHWQRWSYSRTVFLSLALDRVLKEEVICVTTRLTWWKLKFKPSQHHLPHWQKKSWVLEGAALRWNHPTIWVTIWRAAWNYSGLGVKDKYKSKALICSSSDLGDFVTVKKPILSWLKWSISPYSLQTQEQDNVSPNSFGSTLVRILLVPFESRNRSWTISVTMWLTNLIG